jgi:hypothetical protein
MASIEDWRDSVSIDTRLKVIESILAGGAGPRTADGAPITLFFAVYCPSGPAGRADLESYLFLGWTSDDDPPADVHSWGCNMGPEHLNQLAAQGYVIELLHDPAHPYSDATPWLVKPIADEPSRAHHVPDLPAYSNEHTIHWAGYTPGDCWRSCFASEGRTEL